MDIKKLETAVACIKTELEAAIKTGTWDGKKYADGQEAKEALIRSQRLIQRIHEVSKVSLSKALKAMGRSHRIYPPLGAVRPELSFTGLIKAKAQDVVVLLDGAQPTRETIQTGPLTGYLDEVGLAVSERALAVNVRSQLSSIDKNFDTLMERAFAETLNLRLRLPQLVMGEVYMLPVFEYDPASMKKNKVAWKPARVKVEKFIRTFRTISGRSGSRPADEYKYERTALVLVDFRSNPPTIFKSHKDLVTARVLPTSAPPDFDALSPIGFSADLVAEHVRRHGSPAPPPRAAR